MRASFFCNPTPSSYVVRLHILLLILCLTAFGCLESQQELVLNQDGSGKLVAHYILGEKLTRTIEISEEMRETSTGKATTEREFPLNLEELKQEFEGEGIRVENTSFEKKDGALNISYTISFDSILSLLGSRAFKDVEISFYRDVSTNSLAFSMGTKNFQKKIEKEPDLLEGFKATISVTMPDKVLESNADSTQGNTLTWNYGKEKLAPEIMTATCKGSALPFLAKLPAVPKKVVSSDYVYDSTGKPDPFRPFILEASRPKEAAKKPLHPLQQYDLSQLNLVGIIWQVQDPRAILQDSTGKGYIVTKGTLVGKNDGIVSEISESEVVVTEKYTNALGETNIKNISIALHGEESKKGEERKKK